MSKTNVKISTFVECKIEAKYHNNNKTLWYRQPSTPSGSHNAVQVRKQAFSGTT